MGSPAVELQRSVRNALIASVPVAELVGERIYDRRPKNPDYPILTFGPSDLVPEDLECVDLEVHTLQIDAWTQQGGRLHKCRELTGRIKSALHRASLSLNDHALAEIEIEQIRVFQDRDGLTAHGVVIIRALIEQR